MLTASVAHVDPERDLLDWLSRGGARFDALSIAVGRDGQRRAVARRDIACGERVLDVPDSLLLSRDLAAASPIGRAIDAAGVELDSPHSLLAAFVLEEQTAGRSPFAPYLAALPGSLAHMPTFFGPPELALLRGSLALGRIDAQRQSIARDYALIASRVPRFRRHGIAAFHWARLVVVSRVFAYQADARETAALVPLADMLNHVQPRETSWGYVEDERAFAIHALRDFTAGEEVHDSYGSKCNGRFFVSYGFCLPDNPDNEAILRFPADPPAAPVPRRFQVAASRAHEQTRRMFTFLRLACASADEVRLAERSLRGAHDDIGFLGPRNERAALSALGAAAEAALARFPDTLTHDDALLADPSLSPSARSCVIMRSGEKRVLHAFARLARLAARLVDLSPASLLGAAGDLGDEPLVADHLRSVAADLGAREETLGL